MLIISSIKDVTVARFDNISKINVLISEALKANFKKILETPNVKLLVNMEGVDFIDSSGFTAFLTALRTAQKNNGQILICNVSDAALELFKVLHLHTVLKIVDNQTEALSLFE